MKSDIVVDTCGMACPMPIIKAKRAIDSMEIGQVMEVLSTDIGSLNDFTAWVKQVKQELIEHTADAGVYKFYVRKVK